MSERKPCSCSACVGDGAPSLYCPNERDRQEYARGCGKASPAIAGEISDLRAENTRLAEQVRVLREAIGKTARICCQIIAETSEHELDRRVGRETLERLEAALAATETKR